MKLRLGKNCKTSDQMDQFIKEKVESAYHPCGTLRMGTDRKAVVFLRFIRYFKGFSKISNAFLRLF